jgi:hypothetical protein
MQVDVVPKQVKQLLVQAEHVTVPSEVWPAGQAVQVFVTLLYPNPGLHEMQVDVVPKQVKQLLMQAAQATVPSEV